MKNLNEKEHKLLVIWAVDCAEHVLSTFEDYYPDDDRPRKAIEAARGWVLGDFKMNEVRKLAFAAHAAARNTIRPKSIAAARSAGHAAATVHVARHAKYAAYYAANSAFDIKKEINWQFMKLPESLKTLIQLTEKQ